MPLNATTILSLLSKLVKLFDILFDDNHNNFQWPNKPSITYLIEINKLLLDVNCGYNKCAVRQSTSNQVEVDS